VSESLQVNSSEQETRIKKPIIVAGCIVLVIGIATGILIYRNTRAPFRTTVLEVNDTSIKMEYFLKRVFVARTNPRAMLQTLVDEEIIKQTVVQPPYSIKVSDKEIDRAIGEAVSGQSETTDEHTFDALYNQQLERTGFSAEEYRELVQTNLLKQGLVRYLIERIPTVAEQVHLYMIARGSLADAQEVKRRLDDGEDFFALAGELNVDEQLKARGGDLGWYPRNALPENLARTAFEELNVGQPSSPLAIDGQLAVIILVGERAAARRIEEEMLQHLKSRALQDWLQEEYRHHRVVVHGLKNGFNSETEAWVQWQLQEMIEE
jgi:parvulin-like peptidyl-prolyl isomerase